MVCLGGFQHLGVTLLCFSINRVICCFLQVGHVKAMIQNAYPPAYSVHVSPGQVMKIYCSHLPLFLTLPPLSPPLFLSLSLPSPFLLIALHH